MLLVKNHCFWVKQPRKKRFLDVLHRKEAKLFIKSPDWLLQKRLAHALSKKFEISCWFVCLFFPCWYMYKTFLDVLDRKDAFLEIKNTWVFM